MFYPRRSGDDVFRTDDKVKRKKPCTADHVIAAAAVACTTITAAATVAAAASVTAAAATADTAGSTVNATATITATAAIIAATATTDANDEPVLCVSMSPTEEPVQLSHKQLPTHQWRRPRRPDDLRASRLIDRFVDQICMDDGSFAGNNRGGSGDRLSIVSPLAKRLADIRLRRSPASIETVGKRKRPSFSDDDDDDFPQTPVMGGGKRPAAWWWQCSGGGGGGLTLPDGLPSPFYSSHRHHHSHRLQLTVPPSPITPLRRHPADDSDDYWKTPVGPSLVAGVRGESLLSTASSKTADDVLICGSDPRSPAALEETFTLKSRRCLSFVSPPPSERKKNRRSLKKPTTVSASVDKGKTLPHGSKFELI